MKLCSISANFNTNVRAKHQDVAELAVGVICHVVRRSEVVAEHLIAKDISDDERLAVECDDTSKYVASSELACGVSRPRHYHIFRAAVHKIRTRCV